MLCRFGNTTFKELNNSSLVMKFCPFFQSGTPLNILPRSANRSAVFFTKTASSSGMLGNRTNSP